MSVSIENKVALVTGANRGIGKAIVEAFIEQGAKKVYLAVRDPASTAELEARFGNKVSTINVDMADPDSIAALAPQVSDLEVLVNNAGILDFNQLLENNDESALDRLLQVNLYGLLRISRALIPVIENNGGGALVQLNSVASMRNFSAIDFYSASKAAAYSITQGLRQTLSDKNIAVFSVHPGPIATDMAAQAGFTEGASAQSVADALVQALKQGHFHVFPDPVAQEIAKDYIGYAKAQLSERA